MFYIHVDVVIYIYTSEIKSNYFLFLILFQVRNLLLHTFNVNDLENSIDYKRRYHVDMSEILL